MWDEEDNNPYGSFNPDSSADHNNPALSSSCMVIKVRGEWDRSNLR